MGGDKSREICCGVALSGFTEFNFPKFKECEWEGKEIGKESGATIIGPQWWWRELHDCAALCAVGTALFI